ncbi:MAG: C69 family dipeptidase, partial [Phocaeicola sp.]|nr:C69 family dipeptidase [Phocaeicola sp.]
MKLLSSLIILSLFATQSVTAQTNYAKDPESCTSIMAGKKATTDGSVITSHTCDSWYRTWVNMVPAESYEKDTVMNIYDGRMHTEFVADQTHVNIKGQIPQVRKTYAFMDTSYPCINEKQLGMVETTISGRRELVNPKGMFMIEELQR